MNVPRGEEEGNIEVEGKQNLLFSVRPVIKYLVVLHNSKTEIKIAKKYLFDTEGLKNDCACVTGDPVGDAVGAKIST